MTRVWIALLLMLATLALVETSAVHTFTHRLTELEMTR